MTCHKWNEDIKEQLGIADMNKVIQSISVSGYGIYKGRLETEYRSCSISTNRKTDGRNNFNNETECDDVYGDITCTNTQGLLTGKV
jgi:hypothetical protein